jgi:hypothetical protein
MAAIYSNGGNRWNILGFNFTKRDALSSLYKISMRKTLWQESNVHEIENAHAISTLNTSYSFDLDSLNVQNIIISQV